MRCRTCDYALWNLTVRQCPECGEPYQPSDFEFTPGAVRYHCPHCNKAYYGTDGKGHLVPQAFNCVGCGRGIHMDQMSLSPAQGVAEERTIPTEVPWLTRKKNGAVSSFFKTCWWALARPGDLGRSIASSGGVGGALWFAVLVQAFTWTVLMGSFGLVMLIVMLLVGGGAGAGAFGFVISGMGLVVFCTVAATVLILVPLWALAAHLLLKFSGGVRGSFGTTFSSICYSSGANLPTAVPFVGYLVGPIWWLVSATLTVKESQKVRGWRAALAVLSFPIFATFLFVGGYFALIGTAVVAAARAGAVAGTISSPTLQHPSDAANARSISIAIIQQRAKSGGAIPDPIDLVVRGIISPAELISQQGQTTPQSWALSGITLADLALVTPDELQKLRYRLSQGSVQAGDASGFRLGDVVLAYDPLDANVQDPNIWMVVLWPDPKFNPVESPNWEIWVSRVDGVTFQLTPPAFDAALRTQNQLRSVHGLKPLRHPRDVGK